MSNVLDLSVEWSKAKASIDAHNASLKEAINLMPQIAKTFNKPSDAVNVSKQITQTKERIKLTSEEIVNQRILRQNSDRLALSNSKLAGAYRNLSAEVSIASEKVQNIIARGKTAEQTQRQYNKELRNAQREFRTLQNRVLEADKAVDKWSRTGERSIGFVKNLISAFGIVGGVTLFASVTKDIFETTKELQSLDKALLLVTGSSQNFAKQQDFLKKIAEDYGVELKGLTKQYTQFYVSAKDKLSGNQIQDIFRSITKAGASMGLSVQQQERAFLALNQMMSKGTIQAEELRGQLGEALPGALGIMAKAVGVNEAELAKMMKAGQLLSADVLPKFAKQLEITYGIENVNRIDNLSSAQTRLSNSWTNFVRSLDEDGNTLSKFFKTILGTLSEIVKGTTLIFQSETTKQQNSFKNLREKGYNETLQYYNSLDTLNKTDLESNKSYMTQKILDAKKEVDILKGRNLILKALQRETPLGTVETTSNKAERLANEAKIKDIANVTSSYLGQISAINSLLNPEKKHNETTIEGNKEKEKKVKLIKLETVNQLELSKTEDTALEKLKILKKALEQTRDETSKNSTEFQEFEKSIKGVNETIDFLTKGLQPIKLDIKAPFQEAKKDIEALKEATDNWLQSFSSEFLQNSGLGSLETFFDGTFDKLLEGATTTEEKFAVTFNAIAESAQEAFNFISNISQANFDNERKRIEDQQAIAISYAGGSAVAIAKINEDAEKRKKDIANRENKAKQKQAIFNIAIDTAQAIVGLWAKPGFPAAIPLAIAVGALGAVQIAMVASQKIPQYFDGTDNHIGGMMLVNDGGGSNFQEKVILPNGKEIMPEGRNVLMNAPKGTKVLTHEQQIMQMLNERGISMSKSYQSNGMTAQEMDSVMSKHFAKIQTNTTNIDKKGFSQWSERNGNRTIQNNNRVSRTGFKI